MKVVTIKMRWEGYPHARWVLTVHTQKAPLGMSFEFFILTI